MNKIIDILEDLDENINLLDENKQKVIVEKSSGKILNDLGTNFNDLDFLGNNKIKIRKKIKNNNIDSVLKNKKIKDINLAEKEGILKKIELFYLKHKIDKLTGKFNINLNKKSKNKKIKLEKRVFNKTFSFRIKKSFLFILFIFVIFFADKIIIENLIKNGYENLIEIKNDFTNLELAEKKINQSNLYFNISKVLFLPFSIIPNDNISNAENIIDGGISITNFLENGVNEFQSTKKYLDQNKGFENISLTEFLSEKKDIFGLLYKDLYEGVNSYYKVGDLGNKNLNEKLDFVKTSLFGLIKKLEVIDKNYDVFLSLLGNESTRKYLVLLQNNDEIRSTGGFIGSTALVTIRSGKVIDVENKDIYAYEWLVNKVLPADSKEKAPKGLDRITGTFGLRDANYFVNYSSSSYAIKGFLDKIDVNIDGIIYLNQNSVLDLLETIGGVDSKILGEKIDHNNFSLIISTLVEAKVFKVGTLGTPKKILFDFGNELLLKTKHEAKYFDYLNVILKNIESRDIVIYSFNPEENSFLWKMGINGQMNFGENFDFNYPVYTSIGGNKTDRYLEYRYDKIVENIKGTCDFKTTLEIYNSHLFSKFEDEKVNNLLDKYGVTFKRDILNIQGRGDNKSYLRVVLPVSAEISPKEGQVIKKYEKFQIVELFTNTRKLETTKYLIDYKLYNPKCSDYNYKFFKQSGIKKYNINLNLNGSIIKNTKIKSDFLY